MPPKATDAIFDNKLEGEGSTNGPQPRWSLPTGFEKLIREATQEAGGITEPPRKFWVRIYDAVAKFQNATDADNRTLIKAVTILADMQKLVGKKKYFEVNSGRAYSMRPRNELFEKIPALQPNQRGLAAGILSLGMWTNQEMAENNLFRPTQTCNDQSKDLRKAFFDTAFSLQPVLQVASGQAPVAYGQAPAAYGQEVQPDWQLRETEAGKVLSHIASGQSIPLEQAFHNAHLDIDPAQVKTITESEVGLAFLDKNGQWLTQDGRAVDRMNRTERAELLFGFLPTPAPQQHKVEGDEEPIAKRRRIFHPTPTAAEGSICLDEVDSDLNLPRYDAQRQHSQPYDKYPPHQQHIEYTKTVILGSDPITAARADPRHREAGAPYPTRPSHNQTRGTMSPPPNTR